MWNTTTKKQTFNTDREGQWCDKIWGQCWLDYDHDFVDRCYSVSDMLSYIARPLSNVSGCTNIGPTLCFKKWHPFILTITKVKCWPIVMIFVGMYRTLFATNRYIPFTNINVTLTLDVTDIAWLYFWLGSPIVLLTTSDEYRRMFWHLSYRPKPFTSSRPSRHKYGVNAMSGSRRSIGDAY